MSITPTLQGREEWLSSRPVASLIFEVLQAKNSADEYPRTIEVLEIVHGDEMTNGQRSSGYAIVAEMIAQGYVRYAVDQNVSGLQIIDLDAE